MNKLNSKHKRLFIGLWPAPEVRSQISQIQQQLWPVRAAQRDSQIVRTENLHLTLCFLGAVEEQRIAALSEQLAQIHQPGFVLRLQGLGYFAAPRILWLGLKTPEAALQSLALAVHRAALAAVPEHAASVENFSPHISLCRNAVPEVEAHSFQEIVWPVTEFALIESAPAATGVDYQVLERWPLSAAG